MDDSILRSIKKLLGIAGEDDSFDEDIIIHINSAGSYLSQLGVTSFDNFLITDDTAVWSDYILDPSRLADIKQYVYFRVRLAFDPPTNSFLVENIKEQMRECEWRINVTVDPK